MQRHTRAHIRHQRKRHANRRIKLAKQLYQQFLYYWNPWWSEYRQEWIGNDPPENRWPLHQPYNVFANNEAYGRQCSCECCSGEWGKDRRFLNDKRAIKEQLDDMM